MSNRASASPSLSPSPPSPAAVPSEDTKVRAEEAEISREKSGSPEEGSLDERSESPESTSEPPKSPSSDRGGKLKDSSNEATPPEASSSGATGQPAGVPTVSNALVQGDWQAIWSPQHGMYYFHNLRTNETTWTNPLAPSDSSAATAPSAQTRISLQEIAAARGIDPDLAHLDPALAAGPSAPTPFSYVAKFNARTGAFAKVDSRTPEHVSEYERMKRMSNFYFDMDAWQNEVEQRQEEEESGKKRKKPTKKDLEMFKERKKQKKLAKTAWLRT